MDLFATLIVSLRLTTHQQYFRRFPHSFNTYVLVFFPCVHTHTHLINSDEAAANLASLKFSQSNRGPDPRDPARIVTTTTTTTFSMTREMAKAMCQHFMDARLIENAADPGVNLFKDRGTYVLTPKGLHVLERFIAKNGMNADHLSEVFETQPICMKLLHLERRANDDEIIVSQNVITTLFRRFVGTKPNYRPANYDQYEPRQQYQERAKGIHFVDLPDRTQSLLPKGQQSMHRYCFQAVTGLEWLCDFTSVVGREEAAEMAAQFVRFGLITLMSDKRKNNDSAIIFTVRGSTPGGNSPITVCGFFPLLSIIFEKLTTPHRSRASLGAPPRPYTSSQQRASASRGGTSRARTARPRTSVRVGPPRPRTATRT
jgi:GTPase-activating protein SST2